MRSSKVSSGCRCVGLVWGLLATAATGAAPVPYSFTTAAGPFGNLGGPVGAFSVDARVSGSFLFDPLASFTQTAPTGASVYNLSFLNLAGTVEGRSFSDPGGYAMVGNDVALSAGAAPTDILQLGADPTAASATKNLVGFTLPGYRLFNVRLFWIEGQATPENIPDFTGSQSLPPGLPTFHGRLALDFVPLGSSVPTYVFFDGLAVRPVPEPATGLLMGLGLLAVLAGTKRQRPRAETRDPPVAGTCRTG